ncbi:hypothetical protein AKJ65_05805 [candidate division MSBL1 archaeon SCGC-AAA259E19]|uniref:HEAT repeat domain-containing protein n=1 Tax=candidate division MSBL1 archaeon SCGC-AAA259E19 TaxID=1698264 RepID=A0A133UI24_9EURY|nr:hypothetical protein AKJ65_05805 [candidate division MSBL1 archaeon SCGC-AAA259E19]
MEEDRTASRDSPDEIEKLIKGLKKHDDKRYSRELMEELNEVKDEIIPFGEKAVSYLVELVNSDGGWSRLFAAKALGNIGDERAIPLLVNLLEDEELGDPAMDALVEFGPTCIPKVIEKVKQMIARPREEKHGVVTPTMYPLLTIGKIKCDKSVEFLNKLLDDYMSEIPDEPFDMGKKDWKYANVNFFHILDAMVAQQNERAISHIEEARNFFPEPYVDREISVFFCSFFFSFTRPFHRLFLLFLFPQGEE